MIAIKLKIAGLEEKNEETIHNSSEIRDSDNQSVNNVITNSVQSADITKHVDQVEIMQCSDTVNQTEECADNEAIMQDTKSASYKNSEIAQPQTRPSPPSPTPFHSSQFRVPHFEVN